jgi:hypothetical protein
MDARKAEMRPKQPEMLTARKDLMCRRCRYFGGRSIRTQINVSGRSVDVKYSLKNFSTLRNQQQSPLLFLPAELRDRIYTYHCGGMEIHIKGKHSLTAHVCFRRPKRSPPTREPALHQWCYQIPPPALTQVCKQLYAETSTLVLSLNEVGGGNREVLEFLISRLSPTQMQAVTSVRTHTLGYNMDEHCIVERLDPKECTLLGVLAQIKTLKRIAIYKDDYYEYQEQHDESLLKLVKKELAKSRRDGAVGIKVGLEDPVDGYDARFSGLLLPASKHCTCPGYSKSTLGQCR